MKRFFTIASALVIAAAALDAQAPAAGLPPRIDWNARAPWGAQPNNTWFDAIIALMNEKLARERAPQPSASAR